MKDGIMPPIKESDTGTGTLPIGMLVNKLLTEQELGRLIEEATIVLALSKRRSLEASWVEAFGPLATTQTFKQSTDVTTKSAKSMSPVRSGSTIFPKARNGSVPTSPGSVRE
jgi:hypothetical protein